METDLNICCNICARKKIATSYLKFVSQLIAPKVEQHFLQCEWSPICRKPKLFESILFQHVPILFQQVSILFQRVHFVPMHYMAQSICGYINGCSMASGALQTTSIPTLSKMLCHMLWRKFVGNGAWDSPGLGTRAACQGQASGRNRGRGRTRPPRLWRWTRWRTRWGGGSKTGPCGYGHR